MHTRERDIIFVTFRLNSRETFDSLTEYLRLIFRTMDLNDGKGEGVTCDKLLKMGEDERRDVWASGFCVKAVVLVCTKCDILTRYNPKAEDTREVRWEECVEFAKGMDLPLVQVSAKDRGNIEVLFRVGIRELWYREAMHSHKNCGLACL